MIHKIKRAEYPHEIVEYYYYTENEAGSLRVKAFPVKQYPPIYNGAGLSLHNQTLSDRAAQFRTDHLISRWAYK